MRIPLAALRADSIDFPLFLHVLGATVLVGALFMSALSLVLAWRREGPDALSLTRLGFWSFPLAVLPAYVLMRIGAQWTESRSNLTEEQEDSAWIGIGYVTADIGAVLILICLVLAALGLRRLGADPDRSRTFARIVGVVSLLLLAAYLIAAYAMTTKPG
jgi:NADH:ubiquinone oxidoreductase subunit 6 (subunit J)